MPWPGSQVDRDEAFRRLGELAAATWGDSRAAAIAATLRRTSDAIWKLGLLEFEPDERPGFFLTDLARTRPIPEP